MSISHYAEVSSKLAFFRCSNFQFSSFACFCHAWKSSDAQYFSDHEVFLLPKVWKKRKVLNLTMGKRIELKVLVFDLIVFSRVVLKWT